VWQVLMLQQLLRAWEFAQLPVVCNMGWVAGRFGCIIVAGWFRVSWLGAAAACKKGGAGARQQRCLLWQAVKGPGAADC
jgi:hypothetical protein